MQGYRAGEALCVRPPGALADRLGGCVGYQDRIGFPVRRREIPCSRVTVIVALGDPVEVVRAPDGAAGGTLTCFVAGVRDRMAVTGVRGIQRGVQLSLGPARAHAILGLPMHELGNTMVDLAAVLGRDGALLPERLAEAPTWRARFEILAAFLERRLADGPAPDPGVERALRWLAASGGDVRIGELADRLGWTRRHLARRFREQVGLSPKTVARVLRFERMTDLLADGAPPTAGLAAAAGYADQAHLCREIREFARCTPGEYAASLRRTAPDLPVMSHLFNSAEGGPG